MEQPIGKARVALSPTEDQSQNTHLNERDIIKKYIAPLTHTQPHELDCDEDAAVLELPAGKLIVITNDAIIEDTHFFHNDPPETVAKKALRVNLSDIAAMGARPIGYTLCLTFGDSMTEEWLSRFFASLGEDNSLYKISLLGGDTNKSNGPIHISITAIGDISEGCALARSGAQSGDRIYVTGTIGDAAIGLKVLQGQYDHLSDADKKFLISRYHIPHPRHVLGQQLIDTVHSATDISDGLLLDLQLVCEASDLQAYVRHDRIPLSKSVQNLLKSVSANESEMIHKLICAGGDDYELIFTASSGEGDHIEYLAERYGVPITCIGHLGARPENADDQRVFLMDENGTQIPITQLGYEHKW